MKRLVTQKFIVIGSILFNPSLETRKLKERRNYRTLFCQTRRVPTVITDEIHFHMANHEKPVSKSMTAFSLHLLGFILVDLSCLNIPQFGNVFSSEAFDFCDRRDRSDQITQNDPSVSDLNSTSQPVIRKGNISPKSL